jgi:hypothetical protein
MTHSTIGALHGMTLQRCIRARGQAALGAVCACKRAVPTKIRGLVILLIVARAVRAHAARPRGMSDYIIETMPWPEWVRSLCLVAIETLDSAKKTRAIL